MPTSSTTNQTVTTLANSTVRNTDMWTLLGLAMPGVRLVQGWIYRGCAQRPVASSHYAICIDHPVYAGWVPRVPMTDVAAARYEARAQAGLVEITQRQRAVEYG